MPTYFLNVKSIGRAHGSSAPAAAAYRSGESIRDERTGRTHNHSARRDVLHKEILVPSAYASKPPDWTRDRATLWNAAERAESRRNARVAREYLVVLPVELDPGRRVELARGFAQELADRYRSAVDLAVHAPRDFPGSDPRNHHAHLLATTREVEERGLGAKTTVELSDGARRALGLGSSVGELLHVRARWADLTNEALRAAQIPARVDHRSLRAQGIDRDRRPWIPRVPYEIERRGGYSPIAAAIRARQAGLEPADPAEQARRSAQAWLRYRATARPPPTADDAARAWIDYRAAAPPTPTADDAARAWLRYRATARPTPTADDAARAWIEYRAQAAAHTAEKRAESRDFDNDYSL